MIILLILMVHTQFALQISSQKVSDALYRQEILLTLWAYLFGTLIGWRSLAELIKGNIHFSWLLFLATILMSVLVFIPNVDWLKWFGTTKAFFPNLFLLSQPHMVLSVLAGILLVRSFADK